MYNRFVDNLSPITRGQLKIYLGYAPGSGKTYSMLDAGVRRRADAVNVEIACVDIHDHPDNKKILYRIQNEFHARELENELDLDGIISRHPQLVLVDDLAKSNPPEARHPRRYQDVLEILENGIDVYTTLDIGQLESLRDAAWQYPHPVENDTVPDSIFDQASVIEFIDIPPEELIQRLINFPELLQGSSPEPISETFSIDRMTAMREAALRRVAGRLQSNYREASGYKSAQPSVPLQNRILVCISSHPLAERLVRAGRRMADELNANWVVLYVETPDRIGFSYPHTEQLEKTFTLATALGAEIKKIPGHNISNTILDYARQNNITRVILGNPRRNWWQDFFNVTQVDKIIRQSGIIDVYVISDERGVIHPGLLESLRPENHWNAYLYAGMLIVLATAISYPLHFYIDPANLVMVYLAAVTISAIYWGRGPSLMASVLGVLVFDFFMIEPKLSLTVNDTQYLLTLMGFFVVSVVVSNLASTVRVQVEESRLREARTNALYNLSRGFSISLDTQAVYKTIIEQISQTFIRETAIYLHDKNGYRQEIATGGYNPESNWQGIISWVFEQKQSAGFGTNTYPAATTHYHPLLAGGDVVGVVGVQFPETDRIFSTERRQVLDAYCSMAALAIERVRLTEQANQARLSQEKEKLQTALLNSISHDLRTPLATITGVFSTLHEINKFGTPPVELATRMELIDTGWEEAERLNRLVGNLLDMTRLESGAIHLHLVDTDLIDVIGSVLARMKDRLANFKVETDLSTDLPTIPMDITLLEQVLVNLLDNAIKYSRQDGTIQIGGILQDNSIRISVKDQGKCIPEEEIDHIFDKFYRGKSHERISGTGLGLAICKGLVETLGGQIWAANLDQTGVEVAFTLPLTRNIPDREKS
jgi:two-component system, OmpR family, sensor histidine kinase KdpD